jgi:hypothetical protein
MPQATAEISGGSIDTGEPNMSSKTLLRIRPFVALVLVFIAGFAFGGYAQYRSTANAQKKAALSTELFKMRDAIDAFKADVRKR